MSREKRQLGAKWRFLIFIVAFQAIFALIFVTFFLESITGGLPYEISWLWHEVLEGTAALGMAITMALSSGVLLLIFREQRHLGNQIQTVSGEFEKVIADTFATWNLTKSEQEIALLAFKGYSNMEIAELRGTSEGTIKAQINTVFKKSGMKSRTQLIAYFVDDLICEVREIPNVILPQEKKTVPIMEKSPSMQTVDSH